MVNIMTRASLNDTIKDYTSAFYPYDNVDGERIEHIAYNYYEDSHKDWLIYMANDIMDPFHEVYLNNDNFEKYIVKKYTTVTKSKQKILYYRTDWTNDFQVLTTAGYESLASENKKYWDSQLDINGYVNGYVRKKQYFIASTNKIESASFATATSNTLTVGERVTRDDDASSIAVVSWANTTHFVYKHIIGDFSDNTNYTITGEDSGVTATINADSQTVLANVIPTTELSYYSPVYAYDAEEEYNNSKKHINLISNFYANKIEKDLKTIMNKK